MFEIAVFRKRNSKCLCYLYQISAVKCLFVVSAGYAPVTVITYLDTIKDDGDKDKAFDMASWATGSSSERTYFIANYTHGKSEESFVVERTALDVLEFALMSAERFIQIRKQREKNQMARNVAAGGKILNDLS